MVQHAWSPSDVAMLVSSITAGICAIIAAWKATKSDNKATIAAEKSDIAAEKADIAAVKADEISHQASDNSTKLDNIHTLTDGNLTRTQEQLEIEKRKNDYLERLVHELGERCGPYEIESAKKKVEEKQAKIGKRRRSDLVREGDVA